MSTEVEVLTWPDGTVCDVASVEEWTEVARSVAHPGTEDGPHPLDDGKIRTPDQVIDALLEVSRWAARMVLIIENAEMLRRQASAALKESRAQAVIDTAGFPTREQASRVTLAVTVEQAAFDRATVAFEKARRVGNLLSDFTSRLQTVSRQVELTYRIGAGS